MAESAASRLSPDQGPTEATTRFFPLMRLYGWCGLLGGCWSNITVVLLTAPVVVLVANDDFTQSNLQTLGTGFLAAGGALFGVALVGLSVLASFVSGRAFEAFFGSYKRMRNTFAVYYWVAALTVASLIATSALFVVSAATTSLLAWSIATAFATALFLDALFNALWLVGEIIRLALYAPAFEGLKEQLDEPGR